MNTYFRSFYFKLLLLFLTLTSSFAHSSTFFKKMPHEHYNNLTFLGDLFSFALPGIGVIGTIHRHDDEFFLISKVFLSTGGLLYVTDLLQRSFDHTSLGLRPNGYHKSFPSAHSANAFYGARLIHKSFGLHYGAPAYALATLTAYSRIDGKYHHARDVIAGAALAFTIDYLFDQNVGIYAPSISLYQSSQINCLTMQLHWNF